MSGVTETERCDLCGSSGLAMAYDVPGTARGLKAYVCDDCGLVQSLPRIDHVARRSAFPDSGAGFGNIRYGKGFRTQFALDTIAKYRPLERFKYCMDVGANRGSFILALQKQAPDIKIDAVEPDERVLAEYQGRENIAVINKRIEAVALPKAKYDLVYHCHTLEHEAHPLSSLRAVCEAMTPDGILFLEVPNIAFLAGTDLVEEWFIDKHLYHYSAPTLCATLEAAGFKILQAPNPDDVTNLTVIATPGQVKQAGAIAGETVEKKALLAAYAKNLQENQQKLKAGAQNLMTFAGHRRVVIWGAGRIFTSLVDIGGFDARRLAGVVDKNIHKYVSEMFGVAIKAPEAITEMKPDVVLVASRLYLDEIKVELDALMPGTDVLTLDDVLKGRVGEDHEK
ncbi:methyltransferase domain-containing protein [Kordiimonas aestuarii]|uniref:methyltransferase domain-containing protein n=1 Tax=Kordiimonas aestuarii TaxID=1005925 RepID=UPI0021D21E14|nr:methyltransferase domain-containing protein [Kordiimonas aestuarii]